MQGERTKSKLTDSRIRDWLQLCRCETPAELCKEMPSAWHEHRLGGKRHLQTFTWEVATCTNMVLSTGWISLGYLIDKGEGRNDKYETGRFSTEFLKCSLCLCWQFSRLWPGKSKSRSSHWRTVKSRLPFSLLARRTIHFSFKAGGKFLGWY